MKTTFKISAGAALLAMAFIVVADPKPKARPALPASTKELMQQKLEHSQHVLEGLAKEDFGLMLQNARKLRAISQQSAWPFIDNPEYSRHVSVFQRNVDTLIKAIDEQNVDAAAVTYTKVTLNCVECHKFARGQKTADMRAGPSPEAIWMKRL